MKIINVYFLIIFILTNIICSFWRSSRNCMRALRSIAPSVSRNSIYRYFYTKRSRVHFISKYSESISVLVLYYIYFFNSTTSLSSCSFPDVRLSRSAIISKVNQQLIWSVLAFFPRLLELVKSRLLISHRIGLVETFSRIYSSFHF